ncbi:hypothetical protein BC830DRAFT_1088561 [Chytriomyces sp. MP71]|nr:hypothetical protein BC830DRAFT_1088561 [Chytriomyces sp. MP71]
MSAHGAHRTSLPPTGSPSVAAVVTSRSSVSGTEGGKMTARRKLTKQDLLVRHMATDPTKVGLIPVSATNIYLDRLKGWAELVRRLIQYFEQSLAEERRVCDSLGASVRSFATPILVGREPVFESDETMQRFVKDVIEQQNRRAAEHAAAAGSIESETLPNLRDLLKEITSKAYDTDREWADIDKRLASNRETFVKLTRNLRLSIDRQRILFGSDPDSALSKSRLAKVGKDVPRDPWLANLAIQRFLHTLREEYPKTLQALVDQQSRMLVFEKVVIQLLKPTLTSYFSRRSNKASSNGSNTDPMSMILKSLDELDPDKDWGLFLARNKSNLVDPEAVDKDFAATVIAKDVKYDGQDHTRCGFVKEGTLQRNIPGILRSKGYKAGHYVLTVSGFFHGFADEKKDTVVEVGSIIDAGHFALGEPEFSLYLPECVISLKSSDGKDSQKEFQIKGGGGLFGSEKLTLKAETDDNTTFWHDLVTSLAVTPAPIIEPSPRSSLSSSNGVVSPVSPSSGVNTAAVGAGAVAKTETNLMFDSGEEYTESHFNSASGQNPEQHFQDSQTSLYEEEEGEDSDEEMHPSVANALRGRAPPSDLMALRASMTGLPVSGGSEAAEVAGAPEMHAWAQFKQPSPATDMGNAWADVNPSWD